MRKLSEAEVLSLTVSKAMQSIISNKVQGTTNINDEVIASDMLAGAKGGTNAYLNAALAAPLPELRANVFVKFKSDFKRQFCTFRLSNKQGLGKTYSNPIQQLAEAYDKSKTTVET